jgi:hypothetical protein
MKKGIIPKSIQTNARFFTRLAFSLETFWTSMADETTKPTSLMKLTTLLISETQLVIQSKRKSSQIIVFRERIQKQTGTKSFNEYGKTKSDILFISGHEKG